MYVRKGRKHCGKRRKCWLPAFSPFPTMVSPFPTIFSKGLLFWVIKSSDCVWHFLSIIQLYGGLVHFSVLSNSFFDQVFRNILSLDAFSNITITGKIIISEELVNGVYCIVTLVLGKGSEVPCSNILR